MKKKSTLILLVTLLVLAFSVPLSAASFTDVKDNDWFAPFVYDLSDQNILSGYPDGAFRPQNTVTRGEFVKILAFASKDDLSDYGKILPFADSQNHWSKVNIDWAYQNGIVNGKSSTSFDPDGKITRQEMAVMIYRYADYKNVTLPKKAEPIAFSDSNDIASWAKDAVSAMQQSQIISGYPDKTFKPTNNANRGEAAKMISVYIDLSKSAEENREEFLAKDVNDFDADKVINFDNSKTENFGVVLDEVEIIEDDNKTNQVLSKNEETGVYVFGNINDEIKSLKPGDKFVIPGSDPENSVAIVVETITINGTTATIKSKGGEIGDFYQYIQIDMEMEPEAGHIEIVNSDFSYAGSETLSESIQPLNEDGVTPSLKVQDSFKVEHSFNANIHSSNLEAGGTVGISLKVKPVIEYDFELFGKDYIRFDLTAEISNTNKFSVEIKEKPNSEFGEIYKDEIFKIDIPVATGVNVVGGINFIINADGTISVEMESESTKTSGFKYNTEDGYRKIDESESKDPSFKFGMDGKVEAGLEVKLGVEVVELVEASLNTGFGAGVKLSTSIVDTSKVHNCYLCLDGNSYRFKESKFKVELGVGKTKITPINVTLHRAELEYGKCYCSLLNENGELKFGWGECPNIKEKIEDEDGDNTGGGENKPPIEDDPIEDEPELGEIVDSDQCGDNAYWKLDDQGTLLIYGSGDMWDWGYSNDPPWYENASTVKNVIIKDGVTSIGDYAFWRCESLTSITIPNSVTSIGDSVFGYCESLKSITLPNSVTSIGNNAFYDCESLKSITLPNSVTSIGNFAFSDCESLTSITIPNSVTSIGDHVFGRCESLTSITIPNSVTSIGDYAFCHCESLTSITIPNSVTSIGDYAFGYCDSLTSITIPNSVTSIGDYAFIGCSSLTSITIPNSVTSIGDGAFIGCSSLTSITIPNSVTSIGDGAFIECSSLTSITVDSGNQNYSSENGVLFDKNKTILICYPAGKTGTSYSIPNSVTSIGDSVFGYCESLTSITIPNSVMSIGNSAFSHCSSLTSITLPNSVTSIGNFAFDDCDSLTSITIPNSVTSIGDYAFLKCDKLTIYGEAGSTAETYAKENDIPFSPID